MCLFFRCFSFGLILPLRIELLVDICKFFFSPQFETFDSKVSFTSLTYNVSFSKCTWKYVNFLLLFFVYKYQRKLPTIFTELNSASKWRYILIQTEQFLLFFPLILLNISHTYNLNLRPFFIRFIAESPTDIILMKLCMDCFPTKYLPNKK